MRCLVTGATGFVGSHIVDTLLEHGCKVAALVRPTSDLWRIRDVLSSLTIIEGDLVKIGENRGQIEEFQPQVLIHAGWYGVGKHQRDDFDQVRCNLNGSLELLAICLRSQCTTVIGIGSQAEYGQTDQTLVEDMPPQPDTMYGVAKLSTGLISQQMCRSAGTRFAWLRLTASFGPKDDFDHLIPYVITSILRGKVPSLTHGRQMWDYLYSDDVTNAIWRLIDHATAQGIFNLSSGSAIEVRRIAEMIRDRIDPNLPLRFGGAPSDADGRRILKAANDRLRQSTGWAPQNTLAEGIDYTVAWHLQQLARENQPTDERQPSRKSPSDDG